MVYVCVCVCIRVYTCVWVYCEGVRVWKCGEGGGDKTYSSVCSKRPVSVTDCVATLAEWPWLGRVGIRPPTPTPSSVVRVRHIEDELPSTMTQHADFSNSRQ